MGRDVLRRLPNRTCGLTLVEVVVSLGLLALLAAGVFSSALQARRWAEANVREAIAVAIATGFLEQIAATDFPIIIQHVEDRNRVFGFVSRDGQPLSPGKTLRPANASTWGVPIKIPIADTLDADGNSVAGPEMDFWFIPAVSRAEDTPNDAVEIRVRFRWDNGRSLATNFYPERTLVAVRTRIPN